MAQPLDIKLVADRLAAVAERIANSPRGLVAEATMTDLVITAGGPDAPRGTGTTESVPFGVLFHDDKDRLAEALDRLERGGAA